jgi:hypothetical protein
MEIKTSQESTIYIAMFVSRNKQKISDCLASGSFLRVQPSRLFQKQSQGRNTRRSHGMKKEEQ